MTFWLVLAAGLVGVGLWKITKVLQEPTAKEQEANKILSAIWRERAEQELRLAVLNAAVRVTKGRR